VRRDIADGCDEIAGHRHVGRVDLSCRHIDKLPAGQHEVGLANTFSGVNLLS
jgi:hypothetical protein